MTRPRKATVDYFPHSCEHGKTMFVLEETFGMHGYYFWFRLLELLGSTENHFIDCKSPSSWRFLTSKTRSASDKAEEILQCLADMEAIDPELWQSRIIWSQNFVDGIADAYRNRKVDIPIRPDILRQKPARERINDVNLTLENRKLNETKLDEIKDIPRKRGGNKKTLIPKDFKITDRNRELLAQDGFNDPDMYLAYFVDWATANGKHYADWDATFRNCVRGDWGGLREKNKSNGNGQHTRSETDCIHHPGRRGQLTIDGKWYCPECVKAIDQRAAPAEMKTISQLTAKFAM